MLKTAQDYNKFKSGSGATLINIENTKLVDSSICFRFHFFAKLDENYLLSIQNPNDAETVLSIRDWMPRKVFSFHNISLMRQESPAAAWPAGDWNHVCFSYDNNSNRVAVVSNGETVFEEHWSELCAAILNVEDTQSAWPTDLCVDQ